jgi:Tfp pilus assembly protein FimT
MKKRLLVAAVMAAMTISAVPAFAAPTFYGDANIEYNELTDQSSSLTNRIRLSVDSAIADNMYVHGRIVMNNDLKDGTSAPAGDNDIKLEQAFIGGKLGSFDVKAGRQPLWLGKGALADVNGINGIQAATTVNNVKLNGFYGKDGDNHVTAAEFGTSHKSVNFGGTYLQESDANKFLGINADTKIMENAVLNVEYVKNTESKNDGLLAEVKVGSAVKKGDLDYSVAYRNIEAGAVSGYSTDGNYDDSEGFRVEANYKVADNATLTAYQDFTDSQAGAKKNKTNVEFSVNF